VLCPENHCTVKKLSNNVAAVKCKAGDAGMLLLLKGKLSIRKSEIITFVVRVLFSVVLHIQGKKQYQ
jgi:hypothetical protein